jgi:hypothetical protein
MTQTTSEYVVTVMLVALSEMKTKSGKILCYYFMLSLYLQSGHSIAIVISFGYTLWTNAPSPKK